ncbi:bifunctional riboflavin kinase/FAD synthetase [Thermohalobacter berrensis]|uniref:Riboflavin biosynthesis protein n=1 Tax=Thermohalobacter berrensis TaxID=99594 RepID=A0A419TAK1_9FIRM|nr:bifunctional riboflavin kinase/FAD synthetase [Thermohalobacter berrensis]RKD34482.1 riboflavin biosynthesis protein RibF [Thermohalobacter berrensis]
MEVITNIESKYPKPTAVALGNFDGLHIGHQALIKKMIKESKKMGLPSVVYTFKNHPTSLIANKKTPKTIMNNKQKFEILKSLGIDILYMIEFNNQIMNMNPKAFIKKLLIDRLNIKLVVVGFNYRFGYKAKGDCSLLKQMGDDLGFKVIVVPPVTKNEQVVSSTLIRKLIKEGKIKKANNLLGRHYTLQGKVIQGKGRGKKIGFPTANLLLNDNYVIPKKGVYKTITTVNNKKYISITNVGTNPTFTNENKLNIETHIINFNDSLYGKEIEVSFKKYIREEKKFQNAEQLIKQLKEDIKSF